MNSIKKPALGRVGRLAWGYSPLIALALVFVLMAALVPSVDTQTADRTGIGGPSDVGQDRIPAPGEVEVDETGEQVRRTVVEGREGQAGQTRTLPGRGAGSCAGKDRQVPGDPYSPPCVEFEGNNGGATHRGVTADEVVVSFRVLDEPGFQQTLARLAGAAITDRPPDIRRTIEALAEFFNQRYQFYGRQLRIQFYDGAGSTVDELQGAGHAEAQTDADEVAEKWGAFAELNGASEPFIDALTKRGVLAFGTPYLSRDWHLARAPFAWGIATDCSIVAEVAAEFAIKQLVDRPAAFAGGNLHNQPRKLAGLSPENPWYGECHDASIRTLERAGKDPGLPIRYRLHINSMSNQAANVIARLKDHGATTVLCGCDPIFPVFLSAKAAEQNYYPEWIVLGTAFVDVDIVGQLYNQDQWSRAFGVSALGSPIPQRAGLGYSAYKTVRSDEPAFAVEAMYAQMLMLAIGVQMAGPNLNPQTYQQGMFDYPGGHGRFGTWGFDQRSYTPTRDYRILWWDPQQLSIENNKRGGYVESYGGDRFPVGGIPSLPAGQQPPVFRR